MTITLGQLRMAGIRSSFSLAMVIPMTLTGFRDRTGLTTISVGENWVDVRPQNRQNSIHMFEWLADELAEIRTPRFHVVDGPASDELRQAVENSAVPVPPSYRDFVLRFGNASLYRRGIGYQVRVFAGPREHESRQREPLLYFGAAGLSHAHFKRSLLQHGAECPVFEWRHRQGLRQAAGGFEEWLQVKCRAARRSFKKHEWEAILNGPLPFSAEEKAIVSARRCFSWRVVGVSESGDMRFEVHNGSDRVLPYLTVGIRGKSGRLNGGAWLPVGSLMPGQTCVVEMDCYKGVLPPEQVEVFEMPDPGPEDREVYWEFEWVRLRSHHLGIASSQDDRPGTTTT